MDYKLFPIPLADINRPVYYMVKTALWQRFPKNFLKDDDELQEEWEELRDQIGSGYLTFPSADFSFPYDDDTLKREAIMLKIDSESYGYILENGVRHPYVPIPIEQDDYYNPWTGEWEDDEQSPQPEVHYEYVFDETHYFIGFDKYTEQYRVVRRKNTFRADGVRPLCRYNAEEVVQAINRLLPVVKEAHLTRGYWTTRLETTRRMLEEKVNELHTLHNGGLYDSHVLARLLDESALETERWKPLFDEYVTCLKQFAMCVVTLGWVGSPGDSIDSYLKQHKQINQAQIEAIQKERQRRAGKDTEPDDIIEHEPMPTPPLPDNGPLPDSESKSSESSREEKNRAIRRRVFWYMAIAVVMVFVILFAKYSITGSVTVSVGVITAIILRNINRLKEGYEQPSDSQPRWFTLLLVFIGLFGTLGGIVGCKMLADCVYRVSEGGITPWSLFDLVAAVTILVFIYSVIMLKGVKGKQKRLFLFLMVLSASLFVSQCTGSLSSSKQIENIKQTTINPIETPVGQEAPVEE